VDIKRNNSANETITKQATQCPTLKQTSEQTWDPNKIINLTGKQTNKIETASHSKNQSHGKANYQMLEHQESKHVSKDTNNNASSIADKVNAWSEQTNL